jgi:hypothetical protein
MDVGVNMSVSISAAVVVGLRRNEFEDADKLDELLDNGELCMYAPYYDGWQEAIIGIELYRGQFEFDGVKVIEKFVEFHNLTGQHGKLFVAPDVY